MPLMPKLKITIILRVRRFFFYFQKNYYQKNYNQNKELIFYQREWGRYILLIELARMSRLGRASSHQTHNTFSLKLVLGIDQVQNQLINESALHRRCRNSPYVRKKVIVSGVLILTCIVALVGDASHVLSPLTRYNTCQKIQSYSKKILPIYFSSIEVSFKQNFYLSKSVNSHK